MGTRQPIPEDIQEPLSLRARRKISTRRLDLTGLYGFRTLTRWATLCLISARRNHLWGRRGPYPPLSSLDASGAPSCPDSPFAEGPDPHSHPHVRHPSASAQARQVRPAAASPAPATSLAPASAQPLPPHAPLVMAPPMHALGPAGAGPAETQPILSPKGGRMPVLPRPSPPLSRWPRPNARRRPAMPA